mgnify:CR=1 FL=1
MPSLFSFFFNPIQESLVEKNFTLRIHLVGTVGMFTNQSWQSVIEKSGFSYF